MGAALFRSLAVNDCRDLRWLEGSVAATGRMFPDRALFADNSGPGESRTDVAGESLGTES